MLVEEIYRSDMRYTHQSVEFMDIYNYIRGIDETKFKGQFENFIYLKTKFFREFIDDTLHTADEKRAEKSKVFQAAIFSGTFTGNCHANEITSVSGLLVLDVDHLNDTNELERVREIFINNVYVFCCFTSPSQAGLKVLIKHNLTLDKVNDWKYLFTEIRFYYIGLTGLPSELFDTSGADVSRICYLPYCTEKDIYLKENCQTWNYEGKYKPISIPDNTYEYVEIEITDEQYQNWDDLATYLQEHNLDVADSYDEWLSLGYSLATIGEAGRPLFHKISSVSDKYNKKDTDEMFDKCLATLDENRTTIFHYVKVANDAIEYYLSTYGNYYK